MLAYLQTVAKAIEQSWKDANDPVLPVLDSNANTLWLRRSAFLTSVTRRAAEMIAEDYMKNPKDCDISNYIFEVFTEVHAEFEKWQMLHGVPESNYRYNFFRYRHKTDNSEYARKLVALVIECRTLKRIYVEDVWRSKWPVLEDRIRQLAMEYDFELPPDWRIEEKK